MLHTGLKQALNQQENTDNYAISVVFIKGSVEQVAWEQMHDATLKKYIK